MSASNRGTVKMALASLRSTRTRSFLTMLGVIIGITSVVMVAALGEGIKRQVAGQVNHFGKDLITIRPGAAIANSEKKTVANSDVLFGRMAMNGLTLNDVEAVKAADQVQSVAPLGLTSGAITVDGSKFADNTVIVSGAGLPEILNQTVKYGSFWTDESYPNSAVIGSKAAVRLFGDSVPLGQTFIFRGESFVVRGIFDSFHASPLSPTSSFDSAVFLPYQVADRLTNHNVQFYAILAKPQPAQLRAALGSVTSQMTESHGGERDFTVLDQETNVSLSGNIIDLLTAFIMAIAAIALFVGGIGIMNIMLLSVTERMHEIGIRKAVGATNRQILGQFVVEAAILSLSGGVIGVGLSYLVAWLLRTYTDYQPFITWQPVAIAVGVSLLIGIVFGAAPAIKAARKDPIEALRHE